ncbi:DNA adenine methylase [candidate division WOR-3 bacterium]|nr:DNA adenine methylase [candidate division WOR-3 bacterium]
MFGPESLSDADLVAVLFRTGTAGIPVTKLAAQVLEEAGGIHGLEAASLGDLSRTRGVGRVKASQIKAAFELARRNGVSAAGQPRALAQRTNTRRGTRLITFGWYGGKFSHLDWLLPLLPKCTHYCEPFGGSAAVLLNRPPSSVETYNDIDGEVVNFFRVLRDRPSQLIRAIGLTPFAREEFKTAVEEKRGGTAAIERARQFFVRARQVRTGLAQTASIGRWANCLLTSRAGMSGVISRWLGSVEGLAEVAQRLIRVQIENDDALKVIERYDSRETLFYCDPPYPHESRGDTKAYGFEMTDDEHRRLAEALHSVKAKAALSGYACKLQDELYRDWNRHSAPSKICHSVKQLRSEVLWTNY